MDLVISFKLNIWTSQVLILCCSLEIFKTFSLKKHSENIALQWYELNDYPKKNFTEFENFIVWSEK
jgi:hypothetical protein